SESVGPGHPDKICDQVSDAILDACLKQDPYSSVAIECFTTCNLFIVGGEVSTSAKVNYEKIARKTLKDIGYTDEKYGIDADRCQVMVVVKEQSKDIAQGVKNISSSKEIGAGDQGMMFGYACNETAAYMPLPIFLAHELVKEANLQRKNGEFINAGPDMKSQVTIDYTGNSPKVDTILMSIQHDKEANFIDFKEYIKENIIKKVISKYGLNLDYKVFINPTGRFVIGGPEGDTGLTGRKIIVDTYGGYARHGGGAFSGKDCTKVDRSAAYMARYIAKNIVASGVAQKCEIQISYAIGIAEPISLSVDTFGTSSYSDEKIISMIQEIFELTPYGIIKTLGLRKPIFAKTATFGHFGRLDLDLPWEKLDKVESIKKYLNIL
ncbi:MAG: methionine adenosyltransferase, partial [Bacilli bacterium]|nr:methionine adenosyltransferase [Bacilli bacterium]